jgi:hypothetical protein
MQALYKRDKAAGLGETIKDTSCRMKLLLNTGLLDVSTGSKRSISR